MSDPFETFALATSKLKTFRARATHAEDGLRIVLTGHLDGEAAVALQEPLVALVDGWGGAPRLTIALGEVAYIASMGIGTLTRAAVAARKRGITTYLEAPQPSVLKVLDLLGIPQYLPVVPARQP